VNDTAAEAFVHGAEGGTDEFRSRREVIPFDLVGQSVLDGRIVLSEYSSP
jgi:hypothetical protein